MIWNAIAWLLGVIIMHWRIRVVVCIVLACIGLIGYLSWHLLFLQCWCSSLLNMILPSSLPLRGCIEVGSIPQRSRIVERYRMGLSYRRRHAHYHSSLFNLQTLISLIIIMRLSLVNTLAAKLEFIVPSGSPVIPTHVDQPIVKGYYESTNNLLFLGSNDGESLFSNSR